MMKAHYMPDVMRNHKGLDMAMEFKGASNNKLTNAEKGLMVAEGLEVDH
jgi:hypothetical protein